MTHPEMGRELLAHELVEKTVVIVGREDRASAITCWVHKISPEMVAFRAGVPPDPPMLLIVWRLPNGEMRDDTGKRIYVREYLGTV